MLRKSLMLQEIILSLLPRDRAKCKAIAIVVIVQCILVFVGSSTILYCLWSPEWAFFELDKLARIMYLFDSQSCGYVHDTTKNIANLRLPNNTDGLEVLPIKWQPAIVTVSTRLSAKTRKYIDLSLVIHVFWLLSAILLWVVARKSTHLRTIKWTLGIFFYISIAVVCFDISMAIVYVAHIQQSLTKGMVLRYSGYMTDYTIQNPDGFAGWIPMAASIFWMRGIVILILNMYFCKVICDMRRRIRKREVRKKFTPVGNPPIPEPHFDRSKDDKTLYYRSGEYSPDVKKIKFSSSIFNSVN